jgi:hypothetical protein
MSDDNITIITMDDMSVVFSVTDTFGIHRESVSVELAREDPGNVDVTNRGTIEITLPASTAVADFTAEIRTRLESHGYIHDPSRVAPEAEDDDEDSGDDDEWLN